MVNFFLRTLFIFKDSFRKFCAIGRTTEEFLCDVKKFLMYFLSIYLWLGTQGLLTVLAWQKKCEFYIWFIAKVCHNNSCNWCMFLTYLWVYAIKCINCFFLMLRNNDDINKFMGAFSESSFNKVFTESLKK